MGSINDSVPKLTILFDLISSSKTIQKMKLFKKNRICTRLGINRLVEKGLATISTRVPHSTLRSQTTLYRRGYRSNIPKDTSCHSMEPMSSSGC